MRASKVGEALLLDELGKDGRGGLRKSVLERRGVANEEGVEAEPGWAGATKAESARSST